MSIQSAHVTNFVENTVESTQIFLYDSSENNIPENEEVIGLLPMEDMLTSNFTQCKFMGARSPWANS